MYFSILRAQCDSRPLDSLLIFREWHQNFREECPEGILDKERILKIYQQISPSGNARDFVDQLFRIFDKDGNGSIDFTEFMLATDMTASGTPEEKLRWAFKVSSVNCLYTYLLFNLCKFFYCILIYKYVFLSTGMYEYFYKAICTCRKKRI